MPKAPSRKSVFWFFAIPTAAILLLLGGYLARIFYYQHQIEAAREALRADGAPMSFAELAVGPPVPDEDNAALVVNELARRYKELALGETLEKWENNEENQLAWQFTWGRLDAEQQVELTGWLGQKDIREMLALLRTASEKPGWDSTDAPESYAGRPMQNGRCFLHLIYITVLEAHRLAQVALEAKTPEAREIATMEAYGWLLVGLKLSDLILTDRREVGVLKCLFGMIGRSVISDNTVELDRELPLPASLRRPLLTPLAQWDWQVTWPRMMDADRVAFRDEISMLELNEVALALAEVPRLGSWEWGNHKIEKVYGYVSIPSFLRQYAAFLDYQRQFRAWTAEDWEQVQQTKLLYAKALGIPVEDLRVALGASLIWYEQLSVRTVTQAVTATGLAVNAYADDHGGQLPATLEALVPDYLSALPVDPFTADGSGFHYVPTGGHFRLWALGQDGKDDRGTYDPEDWDKGDIVFRGRRAE
ncbi:MAG: hypothetical protein Q7Q73_16925 [Verrucomicrobiota bacterium JB024]|nr:hypothetical protein [Verrucomicrobiota bacterium JB024]